MFADNIHISAGPDFVIRIGQVIHNHTIAISFMRKQSKYKEELFSHSSQIELVKRLQQRLVAEGLGIKSTIEWSYAEKVSAEIANKSVEVEFEYRLPAQLPERLRSPIYAEFTELMDLFAESENS